MKHIGKLRLLLMTSTMAVIKVSERAGDYADQTTAIERLALISRTKGGKKVSVRFNDSMFCWYENME